MEANQKKFGGIGGKQQYADYLTNYADSSTKKFLIQWLDHRIGKGAKIHPKYVDLTSKYLWENAETLKKNMTPDRSMEEIMEALVRYNIAKNNDFIFPFPKWWNWSLLEQYFGPQVESQVLKTPGEANRAYLSMYREDNLKANRIAPLLEEKIIEKVLNTPNTFTELRSCMCHIRVTSFRNGALEFCFDNGYVESVASRLIEDLKLGSKTRIGLKTILGELPGVNSVRFVNIEKLYQEKMEKEGIRGIDINALNEFRKTYIAQNHSFDNISHLKVKSLPMTFLEANRGILMLNVDFARFPIETIATKDIFYGFSQAPPYLDSS